MNSSDMTYGLLSLTRKFKVVLKDGKKKYVFSVEVYDDMGNFRDVRVRRMPSHSEDTGGGRIRPRTKEVAIKERIIHYFKQK